MGADDYDWPDADPAGQGTPEEVEPCYPEDQLRYGHIAVSVEEPAARKGFNLRGWECVLCHKRSTTWTLVPRVR